MLVFPPRPEDFKFSEAKSPRLRIVSYSDAVRTIVVRGITKTGLIHDTYATTNTRTIQTRIIPLTEIPLTVHVETTTTATQRGQLYVQIVLEFAGVPAATLAADYITTASPLSWPGGQIRSSTDGPGAILFVAGTNQGAGADISDSVLDNTIWRIDAIVFTLTTDANIALREAIVTFADVSGNQITFARPTTTQAASLTRRYNFTVRNNVPAAFSTNIAGEIPDLRLANNDNISTVVQNLQAGDNITLIRFRVEQWLTP
jgi:hypothetical protein